MADQAGLAPAHLCPLTRPRCAQCPATDSSHGLAEQPRLPVLTRPCCRQASRQGGVAGARGGLQQRRRGCCAVRRGGPPTALCDAEGNWAAALTSSGPRTAPSRPTERALADWAPSVQAVAAGCQPASIAPGTVHNTGRGAGRPSSSAPKGLCFGRAALPSRVPAWGIGRLGSNSRCGMAVRRAPMGHQWSCDACAASADLALIVSWLKLSAAGHHSAHRCCTPPRSVSGPL